ncbi:MAG TPA: DUF3619 family protein [Zoogloea sp.]|jgi:hypothetical protein|uniref:DUF3619 family protein n=1 Tax=Zoogloea sp. TaxID=49181 RepID=UPI002BFB31DB|nr:DUF3619 family protein [Zoogloea sp.]
MNEQDFQHRIRQHLNVSARNVSPPVADRLLQARQRALSRQKQTVRKLSLAGLGQTLSEHILPHGRTTLAMILVILLALGSGLLGEWQHVADLEEVDSALLADDLPIDAYLDRGFDAWVQNDSPD